MNSFMLLTMVINLSIFHSGVQKMACTIKIVVAEKFSVRKRQSEKVTSGMAIDAVSPSEAEKGGLENQNAGSAPGDDGAHFFLALR